MPETIDYQVSEQTKELWRIELEMTDVLLDFCRLHDLNLFTCYGTLIGVARHKGFIPWDDDIDFIMMRDDYDRLTELIRKGEISLPENYEFDTDDISVIKLRRNDTTMINPSYRWSSDLKQGVWIDVFCIDVAPDDFDAVQRKYEIVNTRIRKYRNCRLGYYAYRPTLRYALGHLALKLYFLFHSLESYRKHTEDMLREDALNYSGEKLWCFMIWSIVKGDNAKIARMDLSWFDDVVWLPFEDRKLPCPIGWEDLLTEQYGDWRTPVIGGSQHEGAYVDTSQPYKQYIESELKRMTWWKRFCFKH